MQSSFLHAGTLTSEGQLASLHISRDQSIPVILSTVVKDAQDAGYAEGMVTNTKFGSFPHSTLINMPWGSQVRASKVDTGSRGRQKGNRKRKAEAISTDSPLEGTISPVIKEAQTAASGFIHLLPPTPESWTIGLPHRTQVVYTPDYSYILHRIRAHPGSVLIEAGSGSGSFTHAAARAVFNGAPRTHTPSTNGVQATAPVPKSKGHVYSFEFHPERHTKVQAEMAAHGLADLVTATHRDVYKGGFLLASSIEKEEKISPRATAVFLDLPAPWEALPQLTRQEPSALNPSCPVYICTFSPCIEQAQKTISVFRRLGWIEIEMVEMQHRKLELRREYIGAKYEGMRAATAVAADVEEAVAKLREHGERLKEAHAASFAKLEARQRAQQQTGKQQDASKTLPHEGNVIHRSEPDLKLHTSYLVFAILPQEWSENDETAAKLNLAELIAAAPKAPKSHRQIKKEAKLKKRNKGGRDDQQDTNGQTA